MYPRVTSEFTVGVLIQLARKRQHLNQEELGKRAARFKIRGDEGPINKNTVSNVERNPYSSDFATVCRLLAALGITLAEAEEKIGPIVREESDRPRRRGESVG